MTMMKQTLFVISVALVFLLSSLTVAGVLDDEARDGLPSRMGGILYVNGTIRFDERTGSPQYDDVIFLDNGRLEVFNVTLTTDRMLCAEGLLNTSMVIQGNDVDSAIVSVKDGSMSIRADEILIRKASISISNLTDPKPNEEDGFSSILILHSEKKDMLIEDSQISIQGEAGGRGITKNAGDGGSVEVQLSTGPGRKAQIIRSRIDLRAGTGGDAGSLGISSGRGGDSKLRVATEGITITDCRVTSEGGDAGSPGEKSVGNKGGQATIDLRTVDDITVKVCMMEAQNGRNTDDTQQAGSNMFFSSENGAVNWDTGKQGADRFRTLSSLKGFTIQVDAEKGAEFHQVDVGDYAPISYGGTRVEVFWWAFLKVMDTYASPIEGASVNYFKLPDQATSYPPLPTLILTNSSGEAALEMVGFSDGKAMSYIFKAELPEGAQNRSDQVRFDQNSNLDITVRVTTLTLELEKPDISRTQGGFIRFEGTARTLSAQNIMKAVTLFVDGVLIGEANDDAELPAPLFSEWSLIWDSTSTPNGPHVLKIVGRDNKYTVTLSYIFIINQTAINHPPVLLRVLATDSLNSTMVPVGSTTILQVDQKSSVMTFKVTAWDRDARSTYLGAGEGKVIDFAEARLSLLSDGSLVYTRQIVITKDNKINETGGYEFSFQIDATKKLGQQEPMEEGMYRLDINIRDDAEISSIGSFITFELIFNFYPNLLITKEPDKERPEEDLVEDFFGWDGLETPKSNRLRIVFNVSDSYDYDDALHADELSWRNLTWTVRTLREGKDWETAFSSRKGIAQFDQTFDLKGAKKNQVVKFYMEVEVHDSEGLPTKQTFVIRIKYIPEDEPFQLFPVGIEYGALFLMFPLLFVLMVLGYVVTGMAFTTKARRERKRKLELIERKKEEERAKGTSTIEEEISSTYMRTSKKYLEATRASKGKESFIKDMGPVPGAKVPMAPASAPSEPVKEGPISDNFLVEQPPPVLPAEEKEEAIPDSFGLELQEPPSAEPEVAAGPLPAVKPTSVRFFKIGGGKEAVLAAYKRILDKAWEDKVLTMDEEAILTKLRKALGISYSDSEALREKGNEVQAQILDKLVKETPSAQRQKVYNHIRGVAMKDGQITPDEQDMLEELRTVLGLASEPAPRSSTFANPPVMAGPLPPPPVPPNPFPKKV